MTQFIKTNAGLVQVDESKIKVYDSIQDAQIALESGELGENEIFATRFSDTGDDVALELNAMADDIARIKSYIPADTDGEDNKLVNQSQLPNGGITGITIEGTAVPITNNVAAISGLASCAAVNTIEGNISDLSSCPGLSCTGTLVVSDLTPYMKKACFSLSGTDLTITI